MILALFVALLKNFPVLQVNPVRKDGALTPPSIKR
jgi:hypothetical protein